MKGKLPELEKLLVSKSGRAAGKYKTAAFAAIGVYLLGGTIWRALNGSLTAKALPDVLLGFASFFAMKYEKIVYLSPEGMVKETHTWITHHREIMRWEEMAFITLMHKKSETMVFLERDFLGWKVLFDRGQADDLKKIFKRFIPDVEINEMDR